MLLGALCLAAAPSSAGPARATLAIGDPAPPLAIERWLRGTPVKRFERGTVYVLDFWAVWCAPCLSGMAHTSDLADRFRARGVRVIALTGPDASGNTLEAVERTLSRRASTMRFDVAWDRMAPAGTKAYADVLQGWTTVSYFEGAQLEGLPKAVIVDGRGRLAWLGTPAALEAPLTAIVEGLWDLKAAAARDRTRREAEPKVDELRGLLGDARYAEADALARTLIAGPLAGEPGYLRHLATLLARERKGGAPRDLDLALDAAERAADLTDLADDTVLAALARVHFVRGDFEAAVVAQEAAVALQDPPMPAQASALETYRRALAGAGSR